MRIDQQSDRFASRDVARRRLPARWPVARIDFRPIVIRHTLGSGDGRMRLVRTRPEILHERRRVCRRVAWMTQFNRMWPASPARMRNLPVSARYDIPSRYCPLCSKLCPIRAADRCDSPKWRLPTPCMRFSARAKRRPRSSAPFPLCIRRAGCRRSVSRRRSRWSYRSGTNRIRRAIASPNRSRCSARRSNATTARTVVLDRAVRSLSRGLHALLALHIRARRYRTTTSRSPATRLRLRRCRASRPTGSADPRALRGSTAQAAARARGGKARSYSRGSTNVWANSAARIPTISGVSRSTRYGRCVSAWSAATVWNRRITRTRNGSTRTSFNLVLADQAPASTTYAPKSLVRAPLALVWRDFALYGAPPDDAERVEVLRDYGLTVAWHVAATPASEAAWEQGAVQASEDAAHGFRDARPRRAACQCGGIRGLSAKRGGVHRRTGGAARLAGERNGHRRCRRGAERGRRVASAWARRARSDWAMSLCSLIRSGWRGGASRITARRSRMRSVDGDPRGLDATVPERAAQMLRSMLHQAVAGIAPSGRASSQHSPR